MSLFGALNLATQKFYWESTDKGNSKSFMQFLNQLRSQFPGEQILLLLDNSSVHKNKAIRAYLQRYPEVFLYSLPPYSPEYNPVEKIWWWIKPLVYGFAALKEGLPELRSRIRKIFWHYNERRIENGIQLNLDTYSNIIKILAI